MNKRTKILTSVFGAAILYVVAANAIYPGWIEPLVTLDRRLAVKDAELEELQLVEERIDTYRREYRDLVARIGSFDIDRVATEVRDRINQLIERHNLRADSVSPSRSRRDRRTEIESMTINVRALGTLESCVGFLRDLAELPQFIQIGNISVFPTSSGREVRGPTMMNLRVPIELRVLPQHKMVGRIDTGELSQPERIVRHLDRDYSPIWDGTPFDDWVPPVPLRVAAGSDRSIRPGERLVLNGSASGGDGEYTFQWSPSDGVSDPTSASTDLLLNEAGNYVYTLTVTDGKGETTSGSVRINVAEPVAAKRPDNTRPPPPPPPPDSRWKERAQMQLVMTLGRSTPDGSIDELMVHNRRTRSNSYHAVGEEFDGGILVAVHQTGGLVRRKDDPRVPKGEQGYFVYPIGMQLDQDIAVEQAEDFPSLQRAAMIDKRQRQSEEKAGVSAGADQLGDLAEEGPSPTGLPKQAAFSALREPQGTDRDPSAKNEQNAREDSQQPRSTSSLRDRRRRKPPGAQ
jgi:hypothetical protein